MSACHPEGSGRVRVPSRPQHKKIRCCAAAEDLPVLQGSPRQGQGPLFCRNGNPAHRPKLWPVAAARDIYLFSYLSIRRRHFKPLAVPAAIGYEPLLQPVLMVYLMDSLFSFFLIKKKQKIKKKRCYPPHYPGPRPPFFRALAPR